MKAAEWKRLVRPLLPPDEEWGFKGSLCYRRPFNCILFGVLDEASGHGGGIYIWQVAMPLFAPSNVLSLSSSSRVGGGARKYSWDEPEKIEAAIVQAVCSIPSEESEMRRLANLAMGSRNTRLVEVGASAQVLLGDADAALKVIWGADIQPDDRPWAIATEERVRKLESILTNEGLEAAERHIRPIINHTSATLGLRNG